MQNGFIVNQYFCGVDFSALHWHFTPRVYSHSITLTKSEESVKTPKGQFSARISPLLRKLIELEIEDGGGSQADAMERLAIRAAGSSPEATKLVLEELEKDPKMKQILALAMGTKPGLGSSASNRKKE